VLAGFLVEEARIDIAEADDLAAALGGVVHVAAAFPADADAGDADAAVEVLAADDGGEAEHEAAASEGGALEELAAVE
jgi:hypothetical protein